jgi:cyclase
LATPEPRVESAAVIDEIGDGCFAYLQPEGTWHVSNAGLFVTDGLHLVVDTLATERRGRRFREAVLERAAGRVDFVVNTHHHGDHTNTNFLFAEATIMAHAQVHAHLTSPPVSGAHELFEPVEWGELVVRPPDVTIVDELRLHGEDRVAAIKPLGFAAHTDCDATVWIPDEGVLYAGDLVFNGSMPLVAAGSVAGSIKALDWIAALQPRVIVPGHGPTCDVAALARPREYFAFVQELAARGKEAGLSPLEVAREADLSRFADWPEQERLPANLHRAFAEIDGSEPDLMPAFRDMVAINGGRLHSLA